MPSRAALAKARERAALETYVRVNPEMSALRQAIAGSRSRFISTARSARGSAEGIRALALAGRPVVDRAYGQALSTRDAEQAVLNQNLGALGPAAADYQAASARESAGARSRIAEARAAAVAGLDSRAQNALAGATYATSAARSQYHSDRGKLETRQRELLRESGALTALGTDKALAEAAAERKANRAYQLQVDQLGETSRHNVATEGTAQQNADTAAEKDRRNRREKGRLTPDAKNTAIGYVGYARSYAREAKRLGLTRGQIADGLLAGRPLEVERPKPGGTAGQVERKTVVPGRQTIGELWASVALDLEVDGHVSRANRNRLRKKGVSAANAGWNTTPPPRPRGVRGLGVEVG